MLSFRYTKQISKNVADTRLYVFSYIRYMRDKQTYGGILEGGLFSVRDPPSHQVTFWKLEVKTAD